MKRLEVTGSSNVEYFWLMPFHRVSWLALEISEVKLISISRNGFVSQAFNNSHTMSANRCVDRNEIHFRLEKPVCRKLGA